MPVTWPESSWKSVERPKAHRRVPRSMEKTVCVEHGPCLWPRVWGVYRVSLFVLYSVLLSFRLFVSVLVLCCSNLCITFISHSVPSVCVSASVGQAVHVGHLCFICPFSLQLVSAVFASVVCSLIILFVSVVSVFPGGCVLPCECFLWRMIVWFFPRWFSLWSAIKQFHLVFVESCVWILPASLTVSPYRRPLQTDKY